MGCLKCGRDTISDQVFCVDCQVEMQKYPVLPGTQLILPERKAVSPVKKQPKKRTIPPEEQVRILKKRCRKLMILLLIVTAIAAALAVPAVKHLTEDNHKIGQNYTTVINGEILP